ncbi:GPI transamidase component PIG-T [Anabrus simplex]|uniref:GPI transamidase component PIG-T n=1 Tax=Anabrus simplex TaxID=316456 RepID=UPI0035A2E105
MNTSFTSLICFALFALAGSVQKDNFNEELLLKPLPSGHVYAHFQFTTLWDVDFDFKSFQHCHLFPRALGEVVGRYNVQELHVSLTEGLWRYEQWGYPVHDAAPGAELWAWFKDDSQQVDVLWKELTSALSGLLCASLNFIDASNSLSPEFSFRPSGVVGETPINSSFLRYAALPREIVCTENLTPWKKLLPCDSRRGLASLLLAGHIHNTNYHSLGLHLRPVCRERGCYKMAVELRQTLSLVYDKVILGGDSQDWSIRKLFGVGLSGACPLAAMSNIYVDVTSNDTGSLFQLEPPAPTTTTSIRGGYDTKFAIYDIKALNLTNMMNIAARYSSPKVYAVNVPPILYANRYIIGYGQERGGIITKIHNGHWRAIDVVYLENIPWFLPVYLHTLKIISNGKEIKPLLERYIPGKERSRPYYLEVLLRLPPRSSTQISIEFDYVFLKWQEYPPDANHGFYVGAAVITAMLPSGRNYMGLPQDGSTITSSFNASREGYLVQLRTETLIITLPTPDFSMPYNVICLACTVVALAFGPLHNITTKRLHLRDCDTPNGVTTWIKSKLSWRRAGKAPAATE